MAPPDGAAEAATAAGSTSFEVQRLATPWRTFVLHPSVIARCGLGGAPAERRPGLPHYGNAWRFLNDLLQGSVAVKALPTLIVDITAELRNPANRQYLLAMGEEGTMQLVRGLVVGAGDDARSALEFCPANYLDELYIHDLAREYGVSVRDIGTFVLAIASGNPLLVADERLKPALDTIRLTIPDLIVTWIQDY